MHTVRWSDFKQLFGGSFAGPAIKIGARVRLTVAAFDVEADYDWSCDALAHGVYGTLKAFGQYETAVIESDDAQRPDATYALDDLEPIVDGDPMSARAYEHARHAWRHAAAARVQALQRGRVVRRQHLGAPAFVDDSDEFFDAPADAGLHGANGAPAFTFGGVRR